MPNRRMIHASIWQDEDIAGLTDRQQLLFIGLFSNADDQGRLKGHPMLIKSLVFPYRDISAEDIQDDLEAIVAVASILRYDVDGKQYLQFEKWWTFQRHQWAKPSSLPAPPAWNDCINVRRGEGIYRINWRGLPDVDSSQKTVATPVTTPNETPLATPKPITKYNITELNDNENDNENPTPTPTEPNRAHARGGGGSAVQEALESLSIHGQALYECLKCPPDDILAWIAYAKNANGLKNPAALVIARLRAGEPPPKAESTGGVAWFSQDEFEKHIAT